MVMANDFSEDNYDKILGKGVKHRNES